MNQLLRILGLLGLFALLPSCATQWQPIRHYEGWTLYEEPGGNISVEAYEAAFEPAFQAVGEMLGEFEGTVRVHAWHGAVEMDFSDKGELEKGEEPGVQEIPGIGPTRVPAYHARGGSGWFGPSGVFIGVPDAGTAVHELVHARYAEAGITLPLWFEEGVASLLGDGMLLEGKWQMDGLACWPLRELREQRLTAKEVEHLLQIKASDSTSAKDNALVHFLGWAIVFDLYRETGVVDWERWYKLFDHENNVADAMTRLERTLGRNTALDWLDRLDDEDPAVRITAGHGTWKLRSRQVLDRLIAALEDEEDDTVRIGLAVNALAAAGEVRSSWRLWRRMQRTVFQALRDAELADPDEQQAARDLYNAYRRRRSSTRSQDALSRLTRFWEE
jgi:hypothetical protein